LDGAAMLSRRRLLGTFDAEPADGRLELAALLYDQAGVQKVIDRLSAVKALLPEKVSSDKDEGGMKSKYVPE
jgi:hypothetical protein